MKAEAYCWRLPEKIKSDLEHAAGLRRVPVSSILDMAVREWLKKNGRVEGGDAQLARHAAAVNCFGVLASGNSCRAETARETIRKRLRKRRAR